MQRQAQARLINQCLLVYFFYDDDLLDNQTIYEFLLIHRFELARLLTLLCCGKFHFLGRFIHFLQSDTKYGDKT